MLLQLHEGRLARDAATAAAAASTPGHTAVDVLGRVGRVGRVHPGLGRAGGTLVGAPPEIRKVERVGADRGHFFEMNRKAVGRWEGLTSRRTHTRSITCPDGRISAPVRSSDQMSSHTERAHYRVLPGFGFTLLHTAAAPSGGSCSRSSFFFFFQQKRFRRSYGRRVSCLPSSRSLIRTFRDPFLSLQRVILTFVLPAHCLLFVVLCFFLSFVDVFTHSRWCKTPCWAIFGFLISNDSSIHRCGVRCVDGAANICQREQPTTDGWFRFWFKLWVISHKHKHSTITTN